MILVVIVGAHVLLWFLDLKIDVAASSGGVTVSAVALPLPVHLRGRSAGTLALLLDEWTTVGRAIWV